jgi:hypothetical protein
MHHYSENYILTDSDKRLGYRIKPPMLVAFSPSNKDSYLLFLKKEAEGRFGPLTRPGAYGQELGPDRFSVIRLEDAARKR